MMRWVRGIGNAVLMATLVKPVVRRMVARWRRRAQESPATSIGIPVQHLLEVALMEELATSAADPEPSLATIAEEPGGRGTLRSMLIAVAVVAATAAAAVTIAALIRRRREARPARTEASELVAVPVGDTSGEAEAIVAGEALVE